MYISARTRARKKLSMSCRGVRATCRERQLIERVRKWLEEERDTPPKKRIEVTQIEKRLQAATGCSIRSLRRYHKEFTEKGRIEHTPKKRVRYHKSRIRINPDDFDRAAIRQTIQQFYERIHAKCHALRVTVTHSWLMSREHA